MSEHEAASLPSSDKRSSQRRRRKKRKEVRRRVLRGVLIVGGLVIVVLAFTAYQAVKAKSAMDTAADRLNALTDYAAAGDPGPARDALFDAQEATLSAKRNTSGPVWWLASKAPVIGDDVTAAKTIIDITDDLTQGVLPDLIDASESLAPEDLQPKNGRIAVDAIREVSPRLTAADERLDEQLERVQAIDTAPLMERVAGPVTQLSDKLSDASVVTGRVSLAARLLPGMLGADGQRTYLILFQNNAEVRATGGIPGALALITCDDGRVELTRQAVATDLGSFRKPVLPLTREEVALFSPNLGIFPADVNFTPDFPRTAELIQEMWRRTTGQTVDGVLSADPVALSYILGGTGAITLATGQQLTAETAVELLLNRVYLEETDPEKQDELFADAAKKVFNALTAGHGSARAMFNGLLQGSEESRLLVWSDDSQEEELLESTVLAGKLTNEATTSPQVGVYLNDGTGAKMDYYLQYDVQVTSESCTQDGRQDLTVTTTLTSTAPDDARTLPIAVRGPGFGAGHGNILTNVLVYLPVDGKASKPLFDGKRSFFVKGTYEGRQVAAQSINLAPGQSHELSYTVTSGAGQPDRAEVEITPGLPGTGAATVGESSC